MGMFATAVASAVLILAATQVVAPTENQPPVTESQHSDSFQVIYDTNHDLIDCSDTKNAAMATYLFTTVCMSPVAAYAWNSMEEQHIKAMTAYPKLEDRKEMHNLAISLMVAGSNVCKDEHCVLVWERKVAELWAGIASGKLPLRNINFELDLPSAPIEPRATITSDGHIKTAKTEPLPVTRLILAAKWKPDDVDFICPVLGDWAARANAVRVKQGADRQTLIDRIGAETQDKDIKISLWSIINILESSAWTTETSARIGIEQMCVTQLTGEQK